MTVISDAKRAAETAGLVAVLGFIDLHAHLREPGFEDSETVASGARAALAGGFTTICAMPNTEPAIDSPGLVAELIARGAAAKAARVLPIAAITRGRKGKELADLIELAAAGAVAFSDDGSPVSNGQLFRNALEYARSAGRPIFEHSQDLELTAGGVMHEGVASARLGLPGMPAAAEESAISRDLTLAKLAGGRLHLSHISTAGGVELVRRAKAAGLDVTAEVTPHHLALTDEWVGGSRAFAWEDDGPRATPYESSTKVNPPLRGASDVRACWAGLMDGTIDAIATDHAPHASIRKDVEFQEAAFGISGFETAVPLLLAGVAAGWGTWERVVAALTTGPAKVLRMDVPANDLVVIDPAAVWTPRTLVSRGQNTPLLGRPLRGRVVAAYVDGQLRYELPAVVTA
ncbi:MAG TPA: dihydroorotase [Candidatus Limnocylindria bacterium]